MITRKELQDIARLKGLSLGNAEKDYLLDIALLSISRNTKNELVFKGGTCLYKFYSLDRFSEDLDFSAMREFDFDGLMNKVMVDFELFGMNLKMHGKKETRNSILARLKVEGPLFTGNPASAAYLGIDINKKSAVEIAPEVLTYSPLYQEIPAVNLLCMRAEEIFAEKVRALVTRERARDMFDLRFLLQKGVRAPLDLIKKKLVYYDEVFDVKAVISKMRGLEKLWETELRGFTSALPEFKDAMKYVSERLRKLYVRR